MIKDISKRRGAFQAIKKKIPAKVTFAKSDGYIDTLEGRAKYRCGDALVTGIKNEIYPITRKRFDDMFEPQVEGEELLYIKRPIPIWALEVKKGMDVAMPDGRGTLHADIGDFILQTDINDLYVITKDIFSMSYDRIENNQSC